MPFPFRKAGKLEAIVGSLIGSAAAAALATFLGMKAKKEFGEWRSRNLALEEWHKAADYNPKVIALYGAHELREDLLERGYGVLELDDPEKAFDAVRRLESICAVVVGKTRLRRDALTVTPTYSIPHIRASGASTVSRLERAIEQESNKAKLLLISVAGYHEATSQIGFHKPKAESGMQEAIAQLFERRRAVMKSDSYDAHRGGVISSLKTGTPIIAQVDYGNLEGICIKIEKGVVPGEIEADYLLFDQHIKARLARPRFYVELGDGALAVIRDYFIGPTLAEALYRLGSAGLGRNNEVIVRKTLNTVFDVTALYHHHKRRESPMTEQGVGEVIAYYKQSLAAAYDTLAPLVQNPVRKEELLELLNEDFLLDTKWYTRVLDISLPNIKICLGTEAASIDQLRDFYIDDGQVRDEASIRASLGFYDQGYVNRHITDAFARAGFSAYIADYESEAWIGYAKSFFVKEYSAGSIIPFSDFFNFRQHMIQLSSALLPNGVATPPELAENFFAISCYKLFRLIEDAVNGAKRNEILFAKGEIGHETYTEYRQNYLRNAFTHAQGLATVSFTGAEYFERYNDAITFSNIFTNMKKALRSSHNHPHANFENPISQELMKYHAMAIQLMGAEVEIENMLDATQRKVPYQVEFKVQP